MSDLHIEFYPLDCCQGDFFSAVIFNESQSALKEVTANDWQMQPYDKSNHNQHCIELTQHSHRTGYYDATIVSSNLTMAATPDGEYYTIEFWNRVANNTFVRSEDTLADIRRVIWDGSKFLDSKVSLTAADLQQYEVKGHLAYDSNLNIAHVMGWLALGNQIVSDTTQMSVLWYTRVGTKIADVSVSTQITDVAGVFTVDIPDVNPDPDEVFVVLVTITDASSVQRTSHVPVTTWD